MTEMPKNAGPVSAAEERSGLNRPATAAVPPELPLFRFGLRQLFLFVAAVCALLAGIGSMGGLPAIALLLAALVVVFHVFSTALGSQLRRHTNNRVRVRDAAPHMQRPAGVAAAKSRPLPWYGRSGASFNWLPRLIVAAVLLGGSLGVVLLTAATGQRTSPAGVVVAAVSLAALSGWLAFLGGSFVGIVRGGLHEVAEHEAKTAQPPVRTEGRGN